MTIDEAIERYTRNAEYERTHENLQGYLDFRQLAEWLKDYKKLLGAIEDIKLEIKEYRYGGEEASETDKDRAEAYNFGLEKALDIVDKHTSGKEDV